MPATRYTESNKKPYGKGHGYGGYANHAFTKKEYDLLMDGESVDISGVKLKSAPGKLFNVTLDYQGEMDSAGRKRYHASNWQEMEGPSARMSAPSGESAGTSPKEEHLDRYVADLEAKADRYASLSVDEAASMSDEELSELARIAQEQAEDAEF